MKDHLRPKGHLRPMDHLHPPVSSVGRLTDYSSIPSSSQGALEPSLAGLRRLHRFNLNASNQSLGPEVRTDEGSIARRDDRLDGRSVQERRRRIEQTYPNELARDRFYKIDSLHDVVEVSFDGCEKSLSMLTPEEIDKVAAYSERLFDSANEAKVNAENSSAALETYKEATEKIKELVIETHLNGLNRAQEKFKEEIETLRKSNEEHDEPHSQNSDEEHDELHFQNSDEEHDEPHFRNPEIPKIEAEKVRRCMEDVLKQAITLLEEVRN